MNRGISIRQVLVEIWTKVNFLINLKVKRLKFEKQKSFEYFMFIVAQKTYRKQLWSNVLRQHYRIYYLVFKLKFELKFYLFLFSFDT